MSNKMKQVFKYEDQGFPIRMYKKGTKFVIQYGQEMTMCDSYDQAAEQLGYAIMHNLQSESILDN